MEGPKISSQSRKRPFEQNASHIQDSLLYKARAVLRDILKELRSDFIEVLKNPDFQNCKAADDIREGMKLLIDLYKDMISESIKLETCANPPDYSSPNIPNGPKPGEHQQDVKPAVSAPQNGAPIELSGHRSQGTYIIGGSAFGWNFITFNSNRAVYYGRTREDFRAANPKRTEGANTNA